MGISLGIPFYNAEEYLEDSIKSVLNQSYQDWELILIDDGSTDKSLEVARKFADSRIRIISDGKNLGLAARLNQIVKEAKYDFIGRMDADDLIAKDKLKKQFEYLERNQDKDIVSTAMCSIDSANNIIGVRNLDAPTKLDSQLIFNRRHNIVHASILVRKDWYIRNAYDETLKRSQDFELWVRSFSKNDLNVGFIPYVGYFYREDLNINKYKMLSSIALTEKLLKRHKKMFRSYVRKRLYLNYKKLVFNTLFFFKLERLILKKRNANGRLDNALVEELSNQIKQIQNLTYARK